MDELLVASLLGEVLLPALLAARFLRLRDPGPAAWGANLLACAACNAMLWRVGLWQIFPSSLLFGWAGLQAAAGLASWRRRRLRESRKALRRLHPQTASSLAIALVASGVLASAVLGPPPPEEETVDLDPPLRGGVFRIIHGGGSLLLNPHRKTLAEKRLAAFRGQAYALDIDRVDALGRRAAGLRPQDPRAYFIFGHPVFAPCDGTVIAVEAGLPDLAPPRIDRDHPAGNFVRLDCGGFEVLLAHLAQASPKVVAGQQVAAGDLLGRVGNSGMSLEPHLHLHAERGGDAGPRPLAVRIGGRLLVRNDRFSPRRRGGRRESGRRRG